MLPDNLPVPEDDGAAAHLVGALLPAITLPTSAGDEVDLGDLGPGRSIIYVYPRSGTPGTASPDGWDAIPGARGCTPEACDFRDHYRELAAAGAARVYGMSSQSSEDQAEFVERLHLPFPMLSDQDGRLAEALDLPTFPVGDLTLLKRLTMVVLDGRIEHVFYPIFPPNTHAQEVLEWLRAH